MYRRAGAQRWVVVLCVALLAAGLAAVPAFASPTGLNDIPTADVVSYNVLVVQGWANSDGDTSWFGGFKVGPAPNLEVGLDKDVAGAGSATGTTFQAKYRFPVMGCGGFTLGLANVATDTGINGNDYPYAVVTVPLTSDKRAAGTLGYTFQSDNHGLFAGANYYATPKLNLRADWQQTDDREDSLSSFGFITELTPDWYVEAWESFPTAPGADDVFTVKVDYVIRLR
jgi:hypothetical protein